MDMGCYYVTTPLSADLMYTFLSLLDIHALHEWKNRTNAHYGIYCSLFIARCTIVQSALLRSHVVCLSVCLSDSVCDIMLEILETNSTDS